MDRLQQYIKELVKHSMTCTGSITLTDKRRDGLASVLYNHMSIIIIKNYTNPS